MSSALSSNEGSCASIEGSEDTVPKNVKNKTATRALMLNDLQPLTKNTMKCADSRFIPARDIMKCLLVYLE